jgi:hypothetical protein
VTPIVAETERLHAGVALTLATHLPDHALRPQLIDIIQSSKFQTVTPNGACGELCDLDVFGKHLIDRGAATNHPRADPQISRTGTRTHLQVLNQRSQHQRRRCPATRK